MNKKEVMVNMIALSLDGVTIEVLAAANTSLMITGIIPRVNNAYTQFMERKIIHPDGSPVFDLNLTLLGLAKVISKAIGYEQKRE